MALVLTRKEGQGIWIENNIYIKLTRTSNHSAQISIDAPKHMNIVREELLWREEQENAG